MGNDMEAALRDWKNHDFDPALDPTYDYFESAQRTSYLDVAKDSNNAYSLIFGCEVDEESPIDSLLFNASRNGFCAAIRAISLVIGVDYRDLFEAIERNSESPFDSAEAEKLMALCEEAKKEREAGSK